MSRLLLLIVLCVLSALSFLGFERLNYLEENKVQVYFYYHERLRPVKFVIPENSSALETALGALLRGPDAAPQNKNIQTLLPEELQIVDALLDSAGTLTLVCNDALLKLSGGHGAIDGALKQIVFTATQIQGIKAVSFRIQNSRASTLVIGGEGYIIDRPLDRDYFKEVR